MSYGTATALVPAQSQATLEQSSSSGKPDIAAFVCPPDFVIRMAALKPEDDLLISHVVTCTHCGKLYSDAFEAAGLRTGAR